MIKKEAVGQRGKTAQDLTKAVLEKMNTSSDFAYDRVSDARAAGGKLKKQLCDYLCWHKAANNMCYSVPLEVKSTEHDYRITKAHLTQLQKLHMVAKAGADPHVLVLFKGLSKWRIAPITFFGFGVPSWDMSSLPLFDTAQEALESTGLFPRIRQR